MRWIECVECEPPRLGNRLMMPEIRVIPGENRTALPPAPERRIYPAKVESS